jgi:ferredoxin
MQADTAIMTQETTQTTKALDRAGLDLLFKELRERGYTLVGPRVRDQAIVYDAIDTTDDLPIGLCDEQDGGRYRLKPRDDEALFGYVVGPHSWKKYLFPPVQKLFSITRNGKELSFANAERPAKKLAFIGVRACELSAIAIQDKIFSGGPFVDNGYKQQRENVFLLAVNCTEPGGTCFCASMETGPRAKDGFDLSLTEMVGPTANEYVVTVGSPLGADVLATVSIADADANLLAAEEEALAASALKMGRSMSTNGIKDLLYRHYEDKNWDEVANRCLSCANCTMVCPTCFCSTVEDVTDLSGEHAERWRKWDSCFNADFSYIHGGVVRPSIRSRYRQWMVHKLGTWHDQFGSSGCVGCGRCITWCPVGIDITQEVAALRANDQATVARRKGVGQ